MLNSLPFSFRNNFRRTWVIGLAFALAMAVSACGGTISNPTTPTPTTLMGSVSSPEPLTQMPALEKTNGGTKVDACGLATKPEAEAVLGQTVTAVTPGVDTTNDFGGTLYFCTFLGKGLAVVISIVDLGSPAAAADSMKTELGKMQSDSTSTTAQEPGLGDQAYWSTSEHACMFTVVKGSLIFSVLLGGTVGDPSTHKTALRTLTESVAARV